MATVSYRKTVYFTLQRPEEKPTTYNDSKRNYAIFLLLARLGLRAGEVLLQHGVDRSVIAMWLGHESMDTTQMYLHANIELKEKALAKTEPFRGQSRRYRKYPN